MCRDACLPHSVFAVIFTVICSVNFIACTTTPPHATPNASSDDDISQGAKTGKTESSPKKAGGGTGLDDSPSVTSEQSSSESSNANHVLPTVDAPLQPLAETPGGSWKTMTDSELFPSGGPSDQEILQSGLGDCIAFCVLGSLASQNPNAIYRMVQLSGVTSAGVQVYTVHLFDPSSLAPIIETVDAQLLFNSAGAPIYDKMYTDPLTQKKVIWPCIVQKALAKYWGGYEHIAGTSESLEIPLMSGMFARKHYSPVLSRALAIADLTSTVKKGICRGDRLCVLWNRGNDGSNLIVTKSGGYNCTQTGAGMYCLANAHEYEVRAFDGNNVQLRNPWGFNQDGDFPGATGQIDMPIDAYFALTAVTQSSQYVPR